jgi:hypothetical protein
LVQSPVLVLLFFACYLSKREAGFVRVLSKEKGDGVLLCLFDQKTGKKRIEIHIGFVKSQPNQKLGL